MTQSGGNTIHSDSISWLPLAPGIMLKPLYLREETGEYAVLVRANKSAHLPRHRHVGEAHIYVVEGLGKHPQTGDYRAGSYVCEREGAIHDPPTFEEDTVMFMYSKGPSEFLGPDDSVLYAFDVAMLRGLQKTGPG